MCDHERPPPDLPCPWPKCPEGWAGPYYVKVVRFEPAWGFSDANSLEVVQPVAITFRRRAVAVRILDPEPSRPAYMWEREA